MSGQHKLLSTCIKYKISCVCITNMCSYYFLEILILLFKDVTSIFVKCFYSVCPFTALVISPDAALGHLPAQGLGENPMTIDTV